MKAFAAVVLIFSVVIGLVVIASVDYGENRSQEAAPSVPAVQPAAAAPPPAQTQAEPVKVELPKPEVIVVPQVIVREVIREVRVERIIERPVERPIERPIEAPRPVYHVIPSPRQPQHMPDRCSNFTGEARDRCYQYVPCAGNRCDQYQGTPNFYPCLKFYGGQRWNG